LQPIARKLLKNTSRYFGLSAAGALLCALQIAQTASAGEAINVAVQSYPTPTSATLSWERQGSVDQFRIERRIVGSRVWSPLGNVPGSSRQFVDTGLRSLTSYEYRLLSFFAGGPSAGQPSIGSALLVTPNSNAPQSQFDAAATPRRIDAQAVSLNEIIVTWSDASSDETNFKVERRQGNGAWSTVALPPANSSLYRDTGLAAGEYEYRVSAERGAFAAIPSAGKVASVGANNLRYVDGCVDNTFAGTGNGSLATPWKSLQSAAFALTAGQTLLVRNRANCSQATLYRSTPSATTGSHNFAVLAIGNDAGQGQFTDGGTRSGTPTAWITYRNYPGERPKIRTSRNGTDATKAGNFHGISVRNASYIVVEGFEIEGHLNDVTLQEATDLNAFYKANTNAPITAVLDSSGITVGNGGQSPALKREMPHHVILRNNIVYSHPGGGINALFADYVTIENNRVWRVGSYSPFGASALNIYRAKDVDSNTSSYKMVIRDNVASEAQNLFPCRCVSYTKQTDGNGIILDQLNNSQTQTTTAPVGVNPPIPPGTYTLPAYAGRTLIINNIITNNGGRGIHAFQSSNADIVYNTTAQNSLIAVTGDGEITSQNSRNVRAFNNIMVAPSNRPTHWIAFASAAAKTADGGTIVFNHNILFGGDPNAVQVQPGTTRGTLGANNRLGLDPRFAAQSGINAYRLLANSPAVDSAWIGGGIVAPTSDVFAAPRPRGGWTDVGAVESF
jgi:Right handed beta helix region